MEGGSHGLFKGTILAFTCGTLEAAINPIG